MGVAVPDWRDEVRGALDFWISKEGGANQTERLVCVGPARQESQRGWYAVDLRDTKADPDQVESLSLAGRAGPDSGASHPVMEAVLEGQLIRVRVAEFVDIADAHLWQRKQPATHLLVKLRDGIAGLADAGLAHELAARRLTPPPAVLNKIAGFTDKQQEAFESCLMPGVRLVWGPPGTGKTRVLTEAIGASMAAGRRVLLVSATNIAVDNALIGVIKSRPYQPGELLRVGPPHHPEVLQHPEFCLPDLVRVQLAEAEQRRRVLEQRLLKMRDRDEELARLEAATTDFDLQEYRRAQRLIAVEASIPDLASVAAVARATAQDLRTAVLVQRTAVSEADRAVRGVAPARQSFADIDLLQDELFELDAAADAISARAVTARHRAEQIGEELDRLEASGRISQLRNRNRIKRLHDDLTEARGGAVELEKRAAEARALIERRRSALADLVERTRRAGHRREDIEACDAALIAARNAVAMAEGHAQEASAQAEGKHQKLIEAEAVPRPTAEQRAVVEHAERHELPAIVMKAADLRAGLVRDQPERARLEQEHTKAQEEFDRLRWDAEGQIIRSARVIATTLARLRTNRALMDGHYDTVLIDEVGAANLPEVLLAVSRAQRTAVLLGDFMQLGAIINSEVLRANRPDVRRWLSPDVFAHCGITTSQDAQHEPGCTALDVQHRFGPDIMRLTNAIAYDGLLKAGPNVRAHDSDDPEIVLIDVDGLGEIARVSATGPRSGWWTAGALLSRVLAEYHQARNERTGVVTPYRHQVAATLEALRDREGTTTGITEVGTAHRFQGREFPIVVFDLVEDATIERWMAHASLRGDDHARNGVRLFNVAVTRVQTRLYLIGSRKRIEAAPADSPLGQIASLLRERRARSVSAPLLIAPTHAEAAGRRSLGIFGSELAELLAEHVRVSDISDEKAFYDVFAERLSAARTSIWIWAPWTATRVRSLLPALAKAVERGVRITLFVRDASDHLQGKPANQQFLADLRAVVPTVVEINVMHQKIVVIDEQVVLLGSLNSLSQSWTREVMLTIHGGHFARRLLEHENAMIFARPPRCGECHGTEVVLRRKGAGEWFWRCYARTCPWWTPRGQKNWTQPAIPKQVRRSAQPSRSARPSGGTASSSPVARQGRTQGGDTAPRPARSGDSPHSA